MILTAGNVEEIFFGSMFTEDEPKETYKEAYGVQLRVGFKPENLEKNKETIISFLDQLPITFKSTEGGGWSFANMCLNKDGEHWTGEHRTMDMLLCLGIAIDKMEILVPRELFHMFNNLPYVAIKE